MNRFQRNQGMTTQEELRALAQHLRFWIVGGALTGAGFVALGAFLGWQRLRPAGANPPWLAELGAVWMVALGFGIVVWVHAFDVWGDRRTILRVLSRLQAEDQRAGPPH
ncbi:MAG: hypothetical protein AB1543_02365 [Candidatus Bipolaricaulota bacterium]